MTEMTKCSFMDLIQDISCDSHPYSTKVYTCNGYYIKLFKETIIPCRAFRISYSYCLLCSTSQHADLTPVGIYWKPTQMMDYYDSMSVNNVDSLESNLAVPEACKLSVYLDLSASAAVVNVHKDILKYICSNLFYKGKPISEEWEEFSAPEGDEPADDFGSVLFLLDCLIDGQLTKDSPIADVLELLILTSHHTVADSDFNLVDILLYRHGTVQEQKKAVANMLCYLSGPMQFETLCDIWNIYMAWDIAYKRFCECTESSIKNYKAIKEFAEQNNTRTTIVFQQGNDKPFSHTVFYMAGIVRPYGIVINGNKIYGFDEIVSIKNCGKTVYKRKT